MAETALLVGGRSRRMGGINKALLTRDGVSVLERTLAFFDRDACFLVGGSSELYGHLNIRCVPDEIPDKGAPGGVYTALFHASTPWVRILPCDHLRWMKRHSQRLNRTIKRRCALQSW